MSCRAALFGFLLSLLLAGFACAQSDAPAASAPAATPATPGDVQELLRLLGEPGVRTWLDDELKGAPAAAAMPAGSAVSAKPKMSDMLDRRIEAVGTHFRTVISMLPQLPAEVAAATDRVKSDLQDRGIVEIILLLAVFILLGLGVEQLFWWGTAHFRLWAGAQPAATLEHRLRSIGVRLALGGASVIVFAIGSIGAFLLFPWPPLLKQIVMTYLVAAVFVRLVLVIVRVLLVPDATRLHVPEQHRVIPTSTPVARFWHRRFMVAAIYLAACWATLELLDALGFSDPAQTALAQLLGLGVLGLVLEVIWRRPPPDVVQSAPRRGRTATNTLLTLYVLLLAVLWIAAFPGLFWLGVIALALPVALSITEASVAHLLRPAEIAAEPAAADSDAPVDAAAVPPTGPSAASSIIAVFLERGIRALLIVVVVLFLAKIWEVDLIAMTTGNETLGTRIARAGLSIVVILLLADLLWELLKAVIDHKLTLPPPEETGSELAVRHARLRTLLPIFRNIMLVVIAGCAALMSLSELGVEIGPLIAGAGVVGVAIGFGAQTIVKDIISGIFYLLDDAFRIGEYIQSGSYTGTVESFSLRSIKLRAPRGPIFTVPFGELGAVENLSRDWAIDKFQIGVTYDTDLDLARRLVKKVGEELKANPDFGPLIIEPLKMQGVQEFGAYAIEIRFKITTQPGQQTTIRRKAYAMIKKAFDENGIKFAFPTVQIAGGEDLPPGAAANPAVANQVLELLQAPKAAEG